MSELDKDFVIARYKDAIDKLEQYQAKEPDRSKRDIASRMITELRDKIMREAWDNVIGRTKALQDLTAQLSDVIERASKVNSVMGVVADINKVVLEVSEKVKDN